ncbi:MAG: o-succinylbenzoate synthase [Phycisphaerae bacterium]|nr:o-succinylbenzoate synthase [Phycisphaerae bacterium]
MAELHVARFRFALLRPMRFAGRVFEHREGFYVRVDGDGIGEVAPLPGVHRETADECLALLRARGVEGLSAFPPALAFGLSCALAWNANDPVVRQPLRGTVGVNALFAGSLDDARRAVDEGRYEGFRTVKVKVSSAADADVVALLAERLPITTRLRLDANRSLEFADAVTVLRAATPVRVEYIEEPLREPLRIPELHFATGHAIALDESLLERDLRAALETAPGVTTHILKPSLHGSIAAVRERAERTARQLLRTTVSNAFESGFTLRLLARISTWLPNAHGDHGFGTGAFLRDDPTPAPEIRDGRIDVREPLPDLAAFDGLRFVPIEAALHA